MAAARDRFRFHAEITAGGGSGAEQTGACWSHRGEGGGAGFPPHLKKLSPALAVSALVALSICHSTWWQGGCHSFTCSRFAAGC